MPVPSHRSPSDTAAVDRWLAALEARHLADLRFSEVTRALRALSATYVERRAGVTSRALDGAGKRAAFAMFYGPLHLLLTQQIVGSLDAAGDVTEVLDVGCGTGVAGAAWALAATPVARVSGLDVHPWALGEAAWTYRQLGLHGSARRGDVVRLTPPRTVDAIVAAYTINELTDAQRTLVLPRLLDAAARGARVLVIEPIATSIVPWWPEWKQAFEAAGGRGDEWRFRRALPDLVKRLDRAAGLRHDEITGRSLYAPGRR